MGMSVPGNSCNFRQMPIGGCNFRVSGDCTYYSGANIPGPNINTGDTLNITINKLVNFIGSGAGSVTSVAFSAPDTDIFQVSGSPITSSGTIQLNLQQQIGNSFLASPSDGSSGIPLFRPIDTSDIPSPMVDNGLSVDNISIGWGQPIGTPGDPAALLEDREIPLNNFTVDFSNGGSILSMDMLGFANSFRLLSNTFFTIGSDSNFVTVQGAKITSNLSYPILQLITDNDSNVGINHDFCAVIQGFNNGGGANEPFLITTSAGGNDTGSAGDIIISPGRAQGNHFLTQIISPYNITLQPCGTGFVQITSKTIINSTFPTVPNPSAQLQIDSTTAGFLPPRMTTVQKNAIVTPTPGLMVYDTSLNKLCVFTGSVWETITSA